MSKNEIIRLSVLGGVVIILIVFLWTIFKKKEVLNTAVYKDLITTKDSLIAAKDDLIKAKEDLNKEKDKSIALHEKNDSLLKTKTVIINKKYNEVPNIINSLNKSQLRDAITNY